MAQSVGATHFFAAMSLGNRLEKLSESVSRTYLKSLDRWELSRGPLAKSLAWRLHSLLPSRARRGHDQLTSSRSRALEGET